jgi:hypothetical protein
MKWDQGLFSIFLVVGATLVGVAACGPSRSEVPLIQRTRAARTFDSCITRFGRHDKIVGGEKQKIEIPVCQVALDGPNKTVRPLLLPVGYTLSQGRNNKPSIQLTIALSYLKPSKDGKAEAASVGRINKLCGEKITKLWKSSGLSAELDLKLVADSPEVETDHVIYLDGAPETEEALTMAHWPNRSRFYSGFRPGDARQCVESVASSDHDRRRKCAAEAFRKAGAETDLFCQDLAMMTAHFLGLAADDAKQGLCEGASASTVASASASSSPSPAASPTASPATNSRAASFMKSAQEFRGEKFWEKVRFTVTDRQAIFAPACEPETSSPVARK